MMHITSRLGTGVGLILAAMAAYWIGLNVSQARSAGSHTHPEGPPRPAWVRYDGTVDVDQMPDCIPALGADGAILADAAGKQICVPKRDLVGPPQSVPSGRNPDEISRRIGPDGSEQVIVGRARRRDQ